MNVAKFKQLPSMVAYMSSKVGMERSSSFGVSNIGVFKAAASAASGAEGKWNIGRMVFSRSAFVAGSVIDVGVVTGPDGCIVLGFCWQEGIVSDELVEVVVEGTREGIESAVG